MPSSVTGLHAHIADRLGGSWDHGGDPRGDNLVLAGGRLYVEMDEEPHAVRLTDLEAEPKGQGMGTRFMEELKAYAHARPTPLIANYVVNPGFVGRFLDPTGEITDMGEHYRYDPGPRT